MDWWENFFDEEYVEAWTAAGSFDNTADLVDSVVRLLALPPGASILDIPCGFGRISGPLSQRGYDVTGVDYSATQLRLAQHHNPGPRYVQADMRHPPPGPFDAVVNLFSSFGYFDDRSDDAAALRAWAGVLRPGGVLVMELMHRDRVAHLHGRPMDQGGPVIEEGRTDWVTGVRHAVVTYGEMVKRFRIRLYTATELVQMLGEAEFSQIGAFGGLDGGDLSPEMRLAIRAVK